MKTIKLTHLSLKIWMGIVGVLLAFTLLLAMTLANVAPQVTVLSQWFPDNVMSFNETIETTNLNTGVKERSLIEEMLIRYYVENRNEYIPDARELKYRWGRSGPIRRLSSPAIFRAFLAEKGNFMKQIEDSSNDAFAQDSIPLTSVDITKISRRDNTFIVDFKLYQNQDGMIRVIGSKRAVIRVVPNNRGAVGFWKDFSNPYGMTVISYKETVNN